MKKFTFIILPIILLTSCAKSFIQLFETASTNTQLKDNYFVYETDTLKITYTFWASKGVMSFAIFNKLDKPIYIDWKNSSFIYNDNKLNYWIDETQTTSSSYYGGYYYTGPLIKPGYTINEGIQVVTATTRKSERITFIPPHSNYYRSQFYLLPVSYCKFDYTSSVFPRNDNPEKNTTVYKQDFSIINSPLRFRDYLAFSFSENSQQFFFIDNGFYLSSIKEMDIRHYRGKKIGTYDNGDNEYQKPYKKPTAFYIRIDGKDCIESRVGNW